MKWRGRFFYFGMNMSTRKVKNRGGSLVALYDPVVVKVSRATFKSWLSEEFLSIADLQPRVDGWNRHDGRISYIYEPDGLVVDLLTSIGPDETLIITPEVTLKNQTNIMVAEGHISLFKAELKSTMEYRFLIDTANGKRKTHPDLLQEQIMIASMFIDGHHDHEIALKLHCSVGKVRYHRKKLNLVDKRYQRNE